MAFLTRIWLLITPSLQKLFRNDSAKQFLNLSLSEQKKLLEDLARYNLKDKHEDKDGVNYRKWRYYLDTIREHYQLPCTVETRENRAKYLEELVGRDRKILLLGDDDLVSWELAKRNFPHVVASDCDPELLRRIGELSAEASHPPKLVYGDFADPNFDPGIKPDVVCIDPPYNLKGTFIFIDKALQTVSGQDKAFLILMINPYCFKDQDLKAIYERLGRDGFALKNRLERFNGYPLQGLSNALLKLGLRVLLQRRPIGRTQGQKLQQKLYFSSDLFLFEKAAT